MPVKKAFLSSTGRDLAEYREAAYHAIEGLDGWHCVRMEDFGARDWEADEFCHAKVVECDILIGIVGHMHGECPKRSTQSYTEREYEAAVEGKKPRLMFLAPKGFPLPADLIEPDRKRKRQQAFRKRVDAERVRASFKSPDDLAHGVAQAIHNWEKEQAAHLEASPPAPVAGPLERAGGQTFGLQANFTGRVRERQMLTQWLTGDDHPVLSLVAIGGMGKSSVAWVWLRRDVLGLPVPGVPAETAETCRLPDDARPEGALWWSFYEGGGTFSGFLEAAIAYCSGGEKSVADYLTVPTATGPSMDYGGMQMDLLQLAQQRRFLFVWDGAERLLREYGQDAAMREERDPEELEPDARDALEMPVSRFLEAIAGQSSSRLLVASRLYPRALETLSGSRCEELTGLAEDDAVAYLRARRIVGNRAELATAAGQYEFHPMSLSNLAADLLADFQQEGDISGAAKYDETKSLKARQHHILERAYDRRAPQRRELLSRLSAMRGTIPKEVVRLLAEDISGMQPRNLGRELSELIRLGLLRHPSADRYDFHPLVRRYCYQRLKGKRKVHLRLRDYYAVVPAPGVRGVKSVEELAPVMERYHHTVGAGLYDQACDLFYGELATPLYYRFGAYQTEIELLRRLFPDREDQPQRLKKANDQAWTLAALANAYSLSGQSRRAVPLVEASNAIDEKLGDNEGLAIGLGNLAMDQIRLGELAAGEASLRREIALCKDIKRTKYQEAVGHAQLGSLLAHAGRFDEGADELGAALAVFKEQKQVQSQCVVQAYRARRALLMGAAEDALQAARQAWRLAEAHTRIRGAVERDFVQAEWLTGWALVALAPEGKGGRPERLAAAERHLTEALRRCRRINMVDNEPDILLAWARWHRAKGNAQQARADADEALAIAERCEYRLAQADAHNFLSRLALDAGDRQAAREHAEVAKERAWCDGPPHCYKPALEEAERLLEEAGSGA